MDFADPKKRTSQRVIRPYGQSRIFTPLAYMALIYYLSSIPGAQTVGQTGSGLLLWVSPNLQNLLHVPLYAGLGWLWLWALEGWSSRSPYLLTFAIASVYGAFDEWHQLLTPGRYFSLTDLMLNVLGVALALSLSKLLVNLRTH